MTSAATPLPRRTWRNALPTFTVAAPERERDDEDDDQIWAAAERGELRRRRNLEHGQHEDEHRDLDGVEHDVHCGGCSTSTSVRFLKSTNGETWITLLSLTVSLLETCVTRPIGIPGGNCEVRSGPPPWPLVWNPCVTTVSPSETCTAFGINSRLSTPVWPDADAITPTAFRSPWT